jgi:TolA-binding protein
VHTYNSGRREDGIGLLRAVAQTYPGTKAARTAQGHLAKIDRA